MPFPVPQLGLVIRYSYLWRREHEQGQEEGNKDRPCAIVINRQNEQGETVVTVVPVTHTPPENPSEAIEIPHATKRRLGLDDDQSWIILSEMNCFVWPGPDMRPVSRDDPGRFDYGFLPPALFEQVQQRLQAVSKARRLSTVKRTE